MSTKNSPVSETVYGNDKFGQQMRVLDKAIPFLENFGAGLTAFIAAEAKENRAHELAVLNANADYATLKVTSGTDAGLKVFAGYLELSKSFVQTMIAEKTNLTASRERQQLREHEIEMRRLALREKEQDQEHALELRKAGAA